MSKAIDEMINEAEERGRVEAAIQLGILKHLTMEQTAADLAAICNITQKAADERIARFTPSTTISLEEMNRRLGITDADLDGFEEIEFE